MILLTGCCFLLLYGVTYVCCESLGLGTPKRCRLSTYPEDAGVIEMNNCELLTANKIKEGLRLFRKAQVMDFSYNKFVDFPDLPYPFAQHLTTLDLRANKIATIDTEYLSPLVKLDTLLIHKNSLEEFPDLTPLNRTLKFLDLSHNRISVIDKDLLEPMTKLEILLLACNRFKEFPDLTPLGPSLTHLYLHNNSIESIDDDNISPLKKLEILLIGFNKITTIPDGLMHLKNIEILHLEHNPINRLPHPVVGLRKLKTLKIHGTNIENIPPIFLENPESLEMINMRQSVDVCNCENTWLKKLSWRLFEFDNKECDRHQWWARMTLNDMMTKCKREVYSKAAASIIPKKASVKTSVQFFLLHSFYPKMELDDCKERCVRTVGCVSFNWRFCSFADEKGACVIIAPGATTVASVPGGKHSNWDYYSLN